MTHRAGSLLDRVADRRDRALARPAHDARAASWLGLALGVCFTVCFATGLYSHLLQQPPTWIAVPPSPAGLYRITQGLHVATGTAAIPLLLAKLWSVYPHLFAWPPFRDLPHLVERASLAVLVAGSVFMLFTGTANIDRWYPWQFFFPAGHYWVAWITMGALVVHIGAKARTVRLALRGTRAGAGAERAADPRPAPGEGPAEVEAGTLSRRGLITGAAAASGLLTMVTVGQTIAPLRRLVLFAPRRPDVGPQGLPVNGAASEAGVVEQALSPGWRLLVDGLVPKPLSLDRADVDGVGRRGAVLPIACVEGWSASAEWGGPSIGDLLVAAGIERGADVAVTVHSLEVNGLYGRSELAGAQVWADDTLLALRLGDEALHLDHGYPARLIAGNRPGVLQTKWVGRLEVR